MMIVSVPKTRIVFFKLFFFVFVFSSAFSFEEIPFHLYLHFKGENKRDDTIRDLFLFLVWRRKREREILA